MLHIRVIKTKGSSPSIQVYYYRNSQRVIVKHLEIISGNSICAFLTHGKKITDARLRNKISEKEIRMRVDVLDN